MITTSTAVVRTERSIFPNRTAATGPVSAGIRLPG